MNVWNWKTHFSLVPLIIVPSHEHHGILKNWQLNYLFKSLCSPANNSGKINAPHSRHLWEESISDQWIPLTKGQSCRERFHVIMSSWHDEMLRPSGPWFNIKMSSYQYRNSHCGDKTVVRSSYLRHGISYTGKMSSYIESGPRWCWNWNILR